MKETGTNGAAPVIGITMAFDDGTHEESLRPGVAIHQVSAAYAWAVEHAGAAPVSPVPSSTPSEPPLRSEERSGCRCRPNRRTAGRSNCTNGTGSRRSLAFAT